MRRSARRDLAQASPLELAERANQALEELVGNRPDKPSLGEQRQILRDIMASLQSERAAAARSVEAAAPAGPSAAPAAAAYDPLEEIATRSAPELRNKRELQVKQQVMPLLMQRIDISVASSLGPDELRAQIAEIVEQIIIDLRLQLNASEMKSIVRLLVDDMVGLGPLEPLLSDESITDIMVNGPSQVYVERKGKLELTEVVFRDDAHVIHVATRIVTEVGRRVDEIDAAGRRAPAGRQPRQHHHPAAGDRRPDHLDPQVLQEGDHARRDGAAEQHQPGHGDGAEDRRARRLNILISGGTGSGKTTLLNALSRMIDHGERIVTIEDAAELQLQQPHVVRLETRPANIEGEGEITMRDLLKNALRMRPDRIIVGEVRGEEALDMLQAMNTGHDGSMSTIHANTPRDALTRLENMVGDGGHQAAAPRRCASRSPSAIHLIVQVQPDARRQAPDHPRHRDHRHGGRRRHHAGPVSLHLRRRERRRHAGGTVRVLEPAAALHAARRILRARAAAAGGDGMPERLDLPVVAIAVALIALVVGLGLVALWLVLREQRKHRRRLARVSRRRISGRYDIEDARLSLARTPQQDSNTLVALADALARFVPPLDSARLRANIHRAGMTMSLGAFMLASVVVAVVLAGIGWLASGAPIGLLALPAAFAGMLLVDAFVRMRGEMMANRFMKQLPDAIDTIIRGIRSGLPVIECIGIAGQESAAPIGPHFRAISERVQLGEPIEGAIWRVARVINKPEMDFLAVAVSIQMETGGSLSEALGNLADLLRKRAQMKLKIKAISSEAKASAMIIGALPFVMLGLLTFMSPEYILPLFGDPRGQLMLGAGLGSISMGAFVMWRMTQFEI